MDRDWLQGMEPSMQKHPAQTRLRRPSVDLLEGRHLLSGYRQPEGPGEVHAVAVSRVDHAALEVAEAVRTPKPPALGEDERVENDDAPTPRGVPSIATHVAVDQTV